MLFLSFILPLSAASNERCGKQFKNLPCGNDNPYGRCCSGSGYCGNTPSHCAIETCQSGCSEFTQGDRCGKQYFNAKCSPDNKFGKCCSEFGYCGSTPLHCDAKTCQSQCNKPKDKVPDKLDKCGDRYCDIRFETCSNCPQDCAKCNLKYVERCVKPGDVALTFDDGPSQHTNMLLDVLKKYEVQATFFVLGSKLKDPKKQQTLKRAYDEGHIIGSHTYDHPKLNELSYLELKQQMVQTDVLIFEIIRQRPNFMRNPFGDITDYVQSGLKTLGFQSIFTSLDTKDSEVYEKDPNAIYDNVINALKGKDPSRDSFIVTQHDTIWRSLYYVEYIIRLFKARGYNLVAMDQCRNQKPYRLNIRDTCGDGFCIGYIENCETCPQDCGRCPAN